MLVAPPTTPPALSPQERALWSELIESRRGLRFGETRDSPAEEPAATN